MFLTSRHGCVNGNARPASPPARGLRRLSWAVLVVLAVAGAAHAADAEPASNLRLMQELARAEGRELASRIPAADSLTVNVTVAPEALAWIVRGPLLEAVQERRAVPVSSGGAFALGFAITEVSVRYENSRRSWLFGARQVDRIVTLSGDASVTDSRTGRMLAAAPLSRSVRDTVDVAAIPVLEEPGVPQTHAPLPDVGFLEWGAEPLIMIGAVAVAVYLLFHVRS